MKFARVAASAIVACAAIPASAAQIVDQSNTSTNGSSGSIVQTFMPTLTGIDFIKLTLNAAGPNDTDAYVRLFAGSGTQGTLLGTTDIHRLTIGSFAEYTFTFASTIALVPEQVYTFWALPVGGANRPFTALNSTANPYARGSRVLPDGRAIANVDFVFSEGVNVLAGGVPEPSTWAMLILGFGVVGSAARVRRRASLSTAEG